MRTLWLFLLLVYSVVDVLAQSPDGFVPVADPEASQILKELNVKWDADFSSIVSIEVRFRRCAVGEYHVAAFTPKEISEWLRKIKIQDQDLFDSFYHRLVDENSFKPHPGNTQTLRDQMVSQNLFRYCAMRRWEQMIHRGGFKSGGKLISDFSDYYYTDTEKYANSNPFNKDAKIGNRADFHMLFSYTTTFFQQPAQRIFWNDPKIFRSGSDPNTLVIEAFGGDSSSKIDRDRGILLEFTQAIRVPQTNFRFIREQIFTFDYFSPANGLWFPRTMLSIFYEPKMVNGQLQGNEVRPSIVYFHTIEDIKINEEMPDSAFHVPAPRGTVVWDYRESREDPFFVQATEEDISDIVTWIDAQKNPSLPEPPRFYNHPIALVISFVIITLFLVSLLRFYRQDRKNKK